MSITFRRWECGSCSHLLGLYYPQGQTLVLKYKSLICWIKGECETVCRFCGTKNSFSTSTKAEDLLDFSGS